MRPRINPAHELEAVQLAERLLEQLDADLDGRGIGPKHPAGEVLARLDRDVVRWRRAATRGRHDAASRAAALRTLAWTQPIVDAQLRSVRTGRRQMVTLR
jgi:hypothetical protein